MMGGRSDGLDRYRDLRLDVDNMSYEVHLRPTLYGFASKKLKFWNHYVSSLGMKCRNYWNLVIGLGMWARDWGKMRSLAVWEELSLQCWMIYRYILPQKWRENAVYARLVFANSSLVFVWTFRAYLLTRCFIWLVCKIVIAGGIRRRWRDGEAEVRALVSPVLHKAVARAEEHMPRL